jgi:spermidine synthase
MDKKIITKFNGPVYITTHNRKKELDTETVNYSFGSLQQILEDGLKKIDFKNVNSVLILGLGGGSVIESLRKKFRFKGEITAVELDPVIIRIANREFNISRDFKPRIISGNAFDVMKSLPGFFDLIIIDLYINNKVPARAFSLIFWKNILRILNQNGKVLFNVDIDGMNRISMNRIIDRFSDRFRFRILKRVRGSNTMMLAGKIYQALFSLTFYFSGNL